MKKCIAIAVLLFTAGLVFAHAPSEITLGYDAKTGMLSINVLHQLAASKVSDPAKHFVKEITVAVNGKNVITENIVFQQSADGEISLFLLNVKSGDKISVKATCNIIGAKTAEITVK